MIKKFDRNHSLIVFYKEDGGILFQDRQGMSKSGEKYGFFGGGVDDGENFEEACIRETKEELNLDLAALDITLAANFSKSITGFGTSENHIFIAEYRTEYDDVIEILEGKAGVWFNLDEAKQQNFFVHDYMVFGMLEMYFDKNGYKHD